MASSTRKWRKRQKEYNRRKRQATRRHQERMNEEQRKRQENLLSLSMGITAKSGFNKNVLSQAIATSKATQTNYLITLARQKRLANAKKRFFTKYNERTNRSRLHYAIKKQDPFAVKLVLGEPGVNMTIRNISLRTPLQTAISYLIDIAEEEITENIAYQKQFEERAKQKTIRLNKAFEILDLLVNQGAIFGVEELSKLWNSSVIGIILERYPQIIPTSYTHRQAIQEYLRGELASVEAEIDEERHEFHRGENGGYGFVPPYLYDEYDKQENYIQVFNTFVKSFDPVSLSYRLFNEVE